MKKFNNPTDFYHFAKRRGCQYCFTAEEIRRMKKQECDIKKCIYLQLRTDGPLYVGQSEDFLQRQRQHLAKKVGLVAVAARSLPDADKAALDKAEKDLIHELRRLGWSVENTQHASVSSEKEKRKEEKEKKTEEQTEALFDHSWDVFCMLSMSSGGRLALTEMGRAEGNFLSFEEEAALFSDPWACQAVVVLSAAMRTLVAYPQKKYGKTVGVELVTPGLTGQTDKTGLWLQLRVGAIPVLRVSKCLKEHCPFLGFAFLKGFREGGESLSEEEYRPEVSLGEALQLLCDPEAVLDLMIAVRIRETGAEQASELASLVSPVWLF